MKLVDRAKLRDDLWKLLLLNSRTADLLDGDLRAMLGSTEVGAQRVTALVDELGIESYFEHLAGVLDHADASMRRAVAALPDGTYLGEDITDNDCFEKRNVAIRVAMHGEGRSTDPRFLGQRPADPRLQELVSRQYLFGRLHGAVVILRHVDPPQ